MRCRLFVLALLLAGSATVPAAGQTVAVDATIPPPTTTGSGVRDLNFGAITINPGGPKTVDVPAAILPGGGTSSGEFQTAVAGAAGLELQLTTPASLTAGPLTLPISFAGATHGGFCWQNGVTTCTLTYFDPVAAPLQRVCKSYKGNGQCKLNDIWGAGSAVRLFVGGQVTVPASQTAATYVGTITLTILAVY